MMKKPSNHLKVLLEAIRQNPSYQELLDLIKPDQPIPRYQPRNDEDIEKARATWIYRSGQHRQYELVFSLLTGTDPPKGDN